MHIIDRHTTPQDMNQLHDESERTELVHANIGYRCGVCKVDASLPNSAKFISETTEEMMDHLRKVHIQPLPFKLQCAACDFVFLYSTEIIKHYQDKKTEFPNNRSEFSRHKMTLNERNDLIHLKLEEGTEKEIKTAKEILEYAIKSKLILQERNDPDFAILFELRELIKAIPK